MRLRAARSPVVLRFAAVFAALVLAAVACTGPAGTAPNPPSPTAQELPGGVGPGALASTARALRSLCTRPPAPDVSEAVSGGAASPAIAEIQEQTQEVRELRFLEPVAAEAVTREEMAARVGGSFDGSFPEEQMARRTLAWQTIGAIPKGASIHDALEEYMSGQILGTYFPESGKLVFVGEELDALGKITLAHELTHALDDQHFHLERLGAIDSRCRDERAMAALGAIEGSAQVHSILFASRFLSVEDLGSLMSIELPPLGGVPTFIQQLQLWPYTAGQAFVLARRGEGGAEAVNRALGRFPVSTEQVLHPERYPSDVPTEVGVPDYGEVLGSGWEDLDVMEIGEAWLQILLDLRLGGEEAANAAAGWDGGVYRAWADGDRMAVALVTVWDSNADAIAFNEAMKSWIGGSDLAFTRVGADGSVLTAFVSAAAAGALDALSARP